MYLTFRFQPISSSWVAVHPQPKGVIQFIGGAFFGTFPTIFYRHLLKQLFNAGYTIVAFPFRFSFRHWSIAASLFVEQHILQNALIQLTTDSATKAVYQNLKNYTWVGHSLGCKYIQLLEFLSSDRWQSILQDCVDAQETERIQRVISGITMGQKISIMGQPSLLIAPDISNTESAIPMKAVAHVLDRVGLGVLPTRKQTLACISQSNLFNLTALVSFENDHVAGNQQDKLRSQEVQENSDVLWLLKQLSHKKYPVLYQDLPGRHLEPMGIEINQIVIDPSPLQPRYLEEVAINLLDQLRQRQH
jgi:hypothetical protein